MAKIFPLHPAKPELICWGCDRYCPANSMICGNGSDRTQHPLELFGEDWHTFGLNARDALLAGGGEANGGTKDGAGDDGAEDAAAGLQQRPPVPPAGGTA